MSTNSRLIYWLTDEADALAGAGEPSPAADLIERLRQAATVIETQAEEIERLREELAEGS